ncbi:predicted protein [Streptomyces filamentosus NRRL 15998]|uniref:Predicted protein n=1 Tax=Streptomyces filamentosus NRRL 15998 TaxID=457431 RepID=D6AGQ7_STRFL|nr:predicted protein [Streptomyces filamentosus NRRL 15998]
MAGSVQSSVHPLRDTSLHCSNSSAHDEFESTMYDALKRSVSS